MPKVQRAGFFDTHPLYYPDTRTLRSLCAWAAKDTRLDFLAQLLNQAEKDNQGGVVQTLLHAVFRGQRSMPPSTGWTWGQKLWTWPGAWGVALDVDGECLAAAQTGETKWVGGAVVATGAQDDVATLVYYYAVGALSTWEKGGEDRLLLLLNTDPHNERRWAMMRRQMNVPQAAFVQRVEAAWSKQQLEQALEGQTKNTGRVVRKL